MGTEPESKPRLCVDCRHYKADSRDCLHPRAGIVSIITGDKLNIDCASMRYGGRCGEAGALWEPLPDAGKEPF